MSITVFRAQFNQIHTELTQHPHWKNNKKQTSIKCQQMLCTRDQTCKPPQNNEPGIGDPVLETWCKIYLQTKDVFKSWWCEWLP